MLTLAAIGIVMLLVLLFVQAASGLVIAGTDVYMQPFGGTFREWVAAGTHDPALVRPYSPETVDAAAYAEMRAFRSPIVRLHEYGFFVLLAMVVFHVAAAVVTELKEGGAVISSMFSGRKVLSERPVDLLEARAQSPDAKADPDAVPGDS